MMHHAATDNKLGSLTGIIYSFKTFILSRLAPTPRRNDRITPSGAEGATKGNSSTRGPAVAAWLAVCLVFAANLCLISCHIAACWRTAPLVPPMVFSAAVASCAAAVPRSSRHKLGRAAIIPSAPCLMVCPQSPSPAILSWRVSSGSAAMHAFAQLCSTLSRTCDSPASLLGAALVGVRFSCAAMLD